MNIEQMNKECRMAKGVQECRMQEAECRMLKLPNPYFVCVQAGSDGRNLRLMNMEG